MKTIDQDVVMTHAARIGVCNIAIVVPTYNERDNVSELVRRLEEVLKGCPWEIVFVDDDSTDGTRSVLISLARKDPRVRLLHRISRRGLATAVVEGVLSTSAPIIAVMDADLQHDERVLLDMVTLLAQGNHDVVVGSRYVEGGGVGNWSSHRLSLSRLGTWLSRLVIQIDLTDPMSGFFVMRREFFDCAVRQLSGQGFKILLDVLASAPVPPRVAEIPYTFRNRMHGDSKLDSAVLWDYVCLVLDKLVGRFVPIRFLMFAVVGGLGVGVHFAALTLLFAALRQDFVVAQTGAALAAMTFNFFVNNILTYRDRRLRGAVAVARGLLSFYLICAVGLMANVGIAGFLFREAYSWWLSGVAGILVGAVWNYAASSIVTWRK